MYSNLKFSLLISIFVFQSAYADDYITYPIFKTLASDAHSNFEKFSGKTFGCIDPRTGEPLACYISAGIEGISLGPDVSNRLADSPDTSCNEMAGVSVSELINKGGHNDSDNVPQDQFVFPNTTLQLIGDNDEVIDESSGPDFYVTGPTSGNGYKTATVKYKTPEYAKVSRVLFQFDAAIGYIFSSRYFTEYIVGTELIFSSDIFKRMPGCINESVPTGEKYRLVIANSGDHPEAHWGQSRAISRAKAIANKFNKKYKLIMSFNDMSLPMGGKFRPHDTHRTGKDIDLNQTVYKTDGTSISYNCKVESELVDGKTVYSGSTLDLLVTEMGLENYPNVEDKNNRYPNLDCYSDGRMHIDLLKGV